MTLCYKMLLLMLMVELADHDGRTSLRVLAERFQEFFVQRATKQKIEENPNRVEPGKLSQRNVSKWESIIREQPVHYLGETFLIDEGNSIRWAPRIWAQWNPSLAQEIHAASLDRLIRYFNRHVPGGY